MPDKVELRINDMKIEHFLSYQIDSDLYVPADAFRIQLANPETDIPQGASCELFVNDTLELTGIIDVIHKKVDKNGVSLSVEGRDLLGVAVDSYCEKFDTVSGKTIKQLAEMLLADIYELDRVTVVYQQNIVGKMKKSKNVGSGFLSLLDTPQKISKIEPGMTVFEVLKTYAASRGMMFYSLPDGTFVFGRPLAKGEPAFTLTLRKDGIGNNVVESEKIDDISKRYSKVTVVGQQQGQNALGLPTQINTKETVPDDEFPFYKPYVTKNNNDSMSPKQHARMIMERQRREGLQMNYTVARHSQDGRNWTINALCRVNDEVQGINGVYLIYGRTFELSKDAGPTTKLKLGPPGLVA